MYRNLYFTSSIILISILFSFACRSTVKYNATQCNPLNISYRFCIDSPSRREAADPTVIRYKQGYLLFASKSGGYWYSDNLIQWNFIETNQIPVEEYAPTAIEINDTVYFLASSTEKSTIYKSSDPLSGNWSVAVPQLEMPVWDPAFFLDDDKRLYLYWGCSNQNPLYGVEVDYRNSFKFKGQPQALIHPNTFIHGWEVPGDYNTLTQQAPWIEGAWVNKINDKYYFQYAGPGTEFKSYSDGVYVSQNPLGPYTLSEHNPFSYKPEGFIAGAGHGSTFADKHGNLWHIATGTISIKHMFERRLVLFPTFVDKDGIMYAYTKYGDYPMLIPDKKINSCNDIFTGWMLLSYNKKVSVSSSVDSMQPENMTDENIRTYWAAQSGSDKEYAMIDLANIYKVYALQVNFAEHQSKILGRKTNVYHRYLIEYSKNGKEWKLLIDESKNDTDNSHPYFQLTKPIYCRYLKIKNIEVPDGCFAISDLRVFGKGKGPKPDKITKFTVKRDINDKRVATLHWNKIANATGYTICYGVDQNKLYHYYTIYNDTTVTIRSLHAHKKYFFTIEAFNESGITQTKLIQMIE